MKQPKKKKSIKKTGVKVLKTGKGTVVAKKTKSPTKVTRTTTAIKKQKKKY